METKNLWESLSGYGKMIPPFEMIKEQANYLEQTTSSLLIGEVLSRFKPSIDEIPDFYKNNKEVDLSNFVFCDFNIIVPNINNYKLALLRCVYSILYIYPANVIDYINEKVYTVDNENEVMSALSQIIQSKRVNTIINNLFSQSLRNNM